MARFEPEPWMLAVGAAGVTAAVIGIVYYATRPRSLSDGWIPVAVSSGANQGVLYVSPDYYMRNGVRIPMSASDAQRTADAEGFVLPTRKMVDAIEQAATLLPFHAHSVRNDQTVFEQNAEIERDIAGRSGLFAGHKKDIVIGAIVGRNPGKVIIYGGRFADGTRVQPLSAAHAESYFDYSHGVRKIKPTMLVNGREMLVRAVLAAPVLSALISDEGPTTYWRYSA